MGKTVRIDAQKLARAIREREVSDYEIERETGVNRSTLGRWRKGGRKAHVITLKPVANFLGVEISALCVGS